MARSWMEDEMAVALNGDFEVGGIFLTNPVSVSKVIPRIPIAAPSDLGRCANSVIQPAVCPSVRRMLRIAQTAAAVAAAVAIIPLT